MISRSSSRRVPLTLSLLSIAAAVLLFGGCQAIFTYSPLSGLQQSPADMTPSQRLTYAQDALASGDQAAMKSAYDAIKNDSGADAQYTTAQLGIELSGVPTVLREIAADSSTITTQLNTIASFIASHGLSPAYMVAAYGQLNAAKAAGATLTDMDYAMGTMGLIFSRSPANWDITASSAGTRGAAQTYLAPAVTDVASLPSGDPLRTFIEDLNTYIGSNIPA
jgi:hypothetical protein